MENISLIITAQLKEYINDNLYCAEIYDKYIYKLGNPMIMQLRFRLSNEIYSNLRPQLWII